jgi:hypothetical protein
MKYRFFVNGLTLATAIAASYLASGPANAQSNKEGSPTASGIAPATGNSTPTPRTADGKPDLTGLWVASGDVGERLIIRRDEKGRTTKLLFAEPDADFSKGDALHRAQRAAAPNQPPYKPELLEKVKYLDEHTNEFDGVLHCMPPGVPRMGPPQQIVQTPGKVVFLYEGGQSSINTFRVIPTDGRQHRSDADPSYLGDSVAHWDGDTLVVDVVGFVQTSWITGDGHFHSDAMRVVERFTRDSDALKYEVTVEDPKVFTRPWVMNPRQLKLNNSSAAAIEEDPPCSDKDSTHLVNHEHH